MFWPDPVFEGGVQAVKLFIDLGGSAEPVVPQLIELSFQLWARHM